MEISRKSTTVTDNTTVATGKGNSPLPPQIESIEVAGLSAFNEVPTGYIVVFVDIATPATGVTTLETFTSETGTVSVPPFEDESGWDNAEIEGTDALNTDDIDGDTLRFGAPDAVYRSEGAVPTSVQRLGNGTLLALFAANETGIECGTAPAAGQLVGNLSDGTPISGAAVIR